MRAFSIDVGIARNDQISYHNEMVINFNKMHGTKNDFVVFHDMEGRLRPEPQQVVSLCDRRSGVGADGIIVVRPSSHADFFMDYVNSDGSVAEMCGNGIRCLAKYVYDNGLTQKMTLLVETRAGHKRLDLFPGEDGTISSVRVDMGEPVFDPAGIPVNLTPSTVPILDHTIEAQGRTFLASILSMGNPHCVIFVEGDIESFPAAYGPSIENSSTFPAKTNVEFVRVLNESRVQMRVWERGSGETLSCGTGACAVAVAAHLKGLAVLPITVELLGGDLEVAWDHITSPVVMTGPATTVYKGTITI